MIPQLKRAFFIVFAAISSFFLSLYLQFEPRIVFGVLFFLLTLKAATTLKNTVFRKSEHIAVGLFSIIFVFSLILGFHITIADNVYDGSTFDNYISPYSIIDLVAIVFVFPSLFIMLLSVYKFISSPQSIKTPPSCARLHRKY